MVPWFRREFGMAPRDVYALTPREAHWHLQDWADRNKPGG